VTLKFDLLPSLEAIGSVKEQEGNMGSLLVPFLSPEVQTSATSAAYRFPEVGATGAN
jgi:hypothetical protein